MNRANVIGPVARGSRRGSPRAASGSDGTSGPAAPGRASGPRAGPRPSTSRSPGPTRVWPPRTIGIGASRADARQGPQPRIGDPVGQQEVAREAVLGAGPASARRRRTGGRGGPAVDERRVAELGEDACRGRSGPSRSRSSPRLGADRTLARRRGVRKPRSSTRARVRDAVERSSQARPPAEARPATTSSRVGSRLIGGDAGQRASRTTAVETPGGADRGVGAGRGRRGRRRAASRGRPGAASDRGGRRPRSRPTRRASAAGRCRRRGRAASASARRSRRSRRRRPSSGCSASAVPGRPAGRRDERAAVGRRGQRDAARSRGRRRPSAGDRPDQRLGGAAPNDRGPAPRSSTIAASAPAAAKPAACRSAFARADRRRAHRSAGPAPGAARGWKMMAATRCHAARV